MGNTCYSTLSNDTYAEELRTAYNVIVNQREQSIPKSGKIRVLSYNCFIRPPMVSGENDDYKDQRLAEFTKAFTQYDILCLQEVFGTWSNRRTNFIERANQAGFKYSTTVPRPDTLSPYIIDGGLVILSKFPIIATEFRTVSQGVSVDALCNKGALYAKIRVGDSKLHLYTIHTQATYDETPKYFLKRSEQLIDFHKFIQETLDKYEYDSKDLVLLTGDFNVDSRSQRQFTKDEAVLAPIVQKYNSLRKSAFTEYNGLISCLSDDYKDEVEDLLFKKYKDHPITFGDYTLSEDNQKIPKDGVLTDISCRCVAESLDYIFKFTPRRALDEDLAMKKQKLSVVEDSVAVQEFFIDGFNFKQLSDHYAVEVTLKYTPSTDVDKEDEETAIGSATYQQEISVQ